MMTKNDMFLEAISFVSELTGVPKNNIMSKRRFRDAIVSKHFLRYYLRKNFNMTQTKIGLLTNCSHSNAYHSIKYVLDYSMFDETYKMYKESIDRKYLSSPTTKREVVLKILNSHRTNEFKCNEILKLIKQADESNKPSE